MCLSIINFLGVMTAIIALIYQIRKDFADRKKDQATKIACWVEETYENEDGICARVCIANMSGLPIYNAVISRDLAGENLITETGNDNCRFVHCVPGGSFIIEVPSTGAGMSKVYNSSITFRDARGENWHRDANGKLTRIKQASIDFRKMDRPCSNTIIEEK